LWEIDVKPDKTWEVTARADKGAPVLYRQSGKYTDFGLDPYEWYQCDDVLMLKGEY
jgi:hypothetical protein